MQTCVVHPCAPLLPMAHPHWLQAEVLLVRLLVAGAISEHATCLLQLTLQASSPQFMVALAPPVSTSSVDVLRAALAPLGGRVLNYLPHHALLVAAPRSAVGAMRALPGEL